MRLMSFDVPRRRFWTGRIVLSIFAMVMLTVGAVQGQASPQGSPSGKGGPTAPEIALETIDGDVFRLGEHHGEVVVLNFWATWCAPCRHEIPGFIELQRAYADRGVQFVGIALQRGAGTEAVRTYTENTGINYPVGIDEGTISQKYGGVRRLPTTFVIGRDGTVQGRYSGLVPKKRLQAGLERLIGGSTKPEQP